MDSKTLTSAPRQIRGLEMNMSTAQNVTFLHAIPVQYTNSDAEPVALVDFDSFQATDGAEPSSRVLNGSVDHGYTEEWLEPGTVVVDGEQRQAVRVFLFDDLDIAEQAENYPWDAKHCARILLRD